MKQIFFLAMLLLIHWDTQAQLNTVLKLNGLFFNDNSTTDASLQYEKFKLTLENIIDGGDLILDANRNIQLGTNRMFLDNGGISPNSPNSTSTAGQL